MKRLRLLFKKWQEKYKLTYIHADTFDVKWSVKLSFINFLTLLVFFVFIISVATYFALMYTPLKRFAFDNVSIYNLNAQLETNNQALRIAEKKLGQQERYLENLRLILLDKPFDDTLKDKRIDTLEGVVRIDFEKSKADSILREKIENNVMESNQTQPAFSADFFMSPVNGKISRSINISEKHYGIDIATLKDEPIKATLEGLVIFSGWTSQQGNVIILQHQNNLLSAYKHCSVLLKSEGEYVETGDPIGIVGNSGEWTDGPHLHFEVWQNGLALDPQEFISF